MLAQTYRSVQVSIRTVHCSQSHHSCSHSMLFPQTLVKKVTKLYVRFGYCPTAIEVQQDSLLSIAVFSVLQSSRKYKTCWLINNTVYI